jgi:MFS family permease
MGALLSIAGGVSLITGNLLLGLSDRIGHKPVAIAAGFTSLAAPLGALYFAHSFVTLVVLMCVGFSAMSTIALFFMAIPANSVPSSSFGTAMGLITGVAELLGSAVIALAGWMADLSSLRAPFYLAIALSILWGSSAFLLRSTAAKSRSAPWPRGLSSESAS